MDTREGKGREKKVLGSGGILIDHVFREEKKKSC